MNHRAAIIGIVGVILVCIGLFALQFPVFLDHYDEWGFQVKCGTGFGADMTQAAAANDTDLTSQCENALLVRRIWTIALITVGGLAVLAVAVSTALAATHESLTTDHRHN